MEWPLFLTSIVGILPLCVSIAKRSILSIPSSVFLATSLAFSFNPEDVVTGIVQAAGSVVLTLSCSVSLPFHRTASGAFRVLWLITIVTSSCTYVYISSRTGADFLPNDVSLIALLVASGLLLASFVWGKACRKKREGEESERSGIVEIVFVAGAFGLRFGTQLGEMISVRQLGVIFWNVASWIALCFTLYFLSRSLPSSFSSSSRGDEEVESEENSL